MFENFKITENLYKQITNGLIVLWIFLIIYYIQFNFTGIKFPHLSRTISEILASISLVIFLAEPVDTTKNQQ